MVIIRIGLFSHRANRPRDPPPARRYIPAMDNFYAGASNRTQVRITTLAERKVDSGQFPPTSPMAVVDNESRQGRSKIEFGDAGEAA